MIAEGKVYTQVVVYRTPQGFSAHFLRDSRGTGRPQVRYSGEMTGLMCGTPEKTRNHVAQFF